MQKMFKTGVILQENGKCMHIFSPKKYLLTSLNPLMVLIGETKEDICGEVICAGGCLLSKVCDYGILRGLLYTSLGPKDLGFLEVDNI